ncbi:hypothetical protein IIC65_00885 [Candidatus Sumerlaeota bacterium]|nr:hypothetical protein [Candidatus Sumerlaeota bacterium]
MISYIQEHIWSHLPARITRKQRVQSAAAWGGALVLFGIWIFWRARRADSEPSWAAAALTVGGVALAAALLTPRLGEAVYLTVLRVTSIVGWMISTVGLVVIFYLMVTPTGWMLRLMGKDPLDLAFKGERPPAWNRHETPSDARRYYRLF